MSRAAGKSAATPPVPSMQGPRADGTYNAVELAEHVLRYGRPAAFTLSTDGILALAMGVDLLVQKLTEIGRAAEELQEFVDCLVDKPGHEQLQSRLDLSRVEVFGPDEQQPNEEVMGNEPSDETG